MPLLTDLPLVPKHLSVLCRWIIPNTSKEAKGIVSKVWEDPRMNCTEKRGAPAPQKCKDGLQKLKPVIWLFRTALWLRFLSQIYHYYIVYFRQWQLFLLKIIIKSHKSLKNRVIFALNTTFRLNLLNSVLRTRTKSVFIQKLWPQSLVCYEENWVFFFTTVKK